MSIITNNIIAAATGYGDSKQPDENPAQEQPKPVLPPEQPHAPADVPYPIKEPPIDNDEANNKH